MADHEKRNPKKRAAKARRRARHGAMIISKSRTKAAAGMNVSGEFYGALDSAVRALIASAEKRAIDNGRRTLRPHDL